MGPIQSPVTSVQRLETRSAKIRCIVATLQKNVLSLFFMLIHSQKQPATICLLQTPNDLYLTVPLENWTILPYVATLCDGFVDTTRSPPPRQPPPVATAAGRVVPGASGGCGPGGRPQRRGLARLWSHATRPSGEGDEDWCARLRVMFGRRRRVNWKTDWSTKEVQQDLHWIWNIRKSQYA